MYYMIKLIRNNDKISISSSSPRHFLIHILWKQSRLRAFEKSLLQRAFGCEREEGEGMRKLGYE
jgi:hypothetical protein